MDLKKWLLMIILTSCGTTQAVDVQQLSMNAVPTLLEGMALENQILEDYLTHVPSAWKGHRFFAEWLVKHMKPQQVVDLGVDYGFSTLSFAIASRENGTGIVTGIDAFQGDPMTGIRNTHQVVLDIIEKANFNNIEIIKGDFNEVSKTWNRTIDILHIDGFHSYEAVSNDFKTWSTFLAEDGIILFHDINVPNPAFGVIHLFRELEGGHKLYFLHTYGLGIFTKNTALYNEIKEQFKNIYDYAENPL